MESLPAFLSEYEAFRERCAWAERGLQEGDITQAKLFLTDIGQMLAGLKALSAKPEFARAIDELAAAAGSIRDSVDQRFRDDLASVANAKNALAVERRLFSGAISFIATMKAAPPKTRADLDKSFRVYQGYDFNAERFYRESEAALEEQENALDTVLATLKTDWPERMKA